MARERVWRAEDPILEVMAMDELPSPRPSHVLARGAYDAPKTDKNRVGRITPAFEQEFLGLFHQVLARARVSTRQAVFVDQHGLMRQPFGPGGFADVREHTLAEFAGPPPWRNRTQSPVPPST